MNKLEHLVEELRKNSLANPATETEKTFEESCMSLGTAFRESCLSMGDAFRQSCLSLGDSFKEICQNVDRNKK
ncbi:MAG: hypothetical protein JSV63_00535 [Candidatus Aenigmatarchaeota archaeon]|nr:MAG: hypothetical protein JSV63_00535 [Candidatus Aenigmarchaeota archaeon]